MVPIIYTTYGVAMGHRPETLAAAGALRPAGPRRGDGPHGAARARMLLVAVLVQSSMWCLGAVRRLESSQQWLPRSPDPF